MQRVRTKRVKTTEEILKANLAKTLGRIKTKVAKVEELWLEMFQDITSTLLTKEEEEFGAQDNLEDRVKTAAMLADVALDCYESRWGKG